MTPAAAVDDGDGERDHYTIRTCVDGSRMHCVDCCSSPEQGHGERCRLDALRVFLRGEETL